MKAYLYFLIAFITFNISLVAGDANFTASSKAKTLALNGMYFAGVDGLQSVLGNPSGLAYLNSRAIEINLNDYIGQYEFENLLSEPFQSYNDDDFSFGGGIYWSISPSFTAALSYQRAIDYHINWPYANFFSLDSVSSLLAFDFYNEISVDAASASFAMMFDNISVGATANFYYIEQHTAFPRSNERWNQNLGQAGYQFNYDQDGYTFGFNLGASLQLNDQLRIGVMTRSGFKADLEGNASSMMFAELDSTSSIVNLSGSFEMPWIVGGGLVYNWTDDLTINFDVQYNLWDGIQKSFDFTFDNSIWQQNLSSVDSLTDINAAGFTLAFQNTFDAGLGIEYKTSDFVLRGGYLFSQSPNTNDTYNMIFPSVDQHRVSLGIGYQNENLLADVSIAYAFGVTKEVSKPNINNLSGNYSSSVVMPSVTLRYLF